MLNSHDAKIVAADPELPALRAILDEDAALALFANHVPGLQATAARCTYLRYKPHTSCRATYTLDTCAGEQCLHIEAHRPDAVDKLAKVSRGSRTQEAHSNAHSATPMVVRELAIVISQFPCDRELPSLEQVSTRDGQVQLLSRMLPADNKELLSAEWSTLRYKPGRRFVARLDANNIPQAVLKLHSERVYAQSRRAAKSLGSLAEINTARPLGHSDRHRAVLLQWLAGESLSSLLTKTQLHASIIGQIGQLLARLHAQQTRKLPHRNVEAEAQEIRRSAEDLATIAPLLKGMLDKVAQKCAAQLAQLPPLAVPIHGDCHPEQIIVNQTEVAQTKVAMIDLDSAALGHPADDLGNFLAHLEREVLFGSLPRHFCAQLAEDLLSGYSESSTTLDRHAVQTYRALGILRLAHEPFRYRHSNWHGETENLIEHALSILEKNPQPSKPTKYPPAIKKNTPCDEVTDPFSIGNDHKLQNIATAIDPRFAGQTIVPIIRQTFEDESLEIRSIRVLRHKPGRRCLIQYTCASAIDNRAVTILGKIHAKSRHESSHRLQQALWKSDFHYESEDGISVARPVGTVPECQMWLQESVSGISGWEALLGPSPETLAAQISAAAHKLHQADILTERKHTLEDELNILEEKLPIVVRHSPRLKSRISSVLAACRDLVASLPLPEPKGIHRDFYPDQIVFDAGRLFVLDHDLYCLGDPALDIGNFCGHLIEHSLRLHGHADAYAKFQRDLCARFMSLRENRSLATVYAYTTLTLVRHIFLSTQFAGRCSKTELILDHCERTLALQKA